MFLSFLSFFWIFDFCFLTSFPFLSFFEFLEFLIYLFLQFFSYVFDSFCLFWHFLSFVVIYLSFFSFCLFLSFVCHLFVIVCHFCHFLSVCLWFFVIVLSFSDFLFFDFMRDFTLPKGLTFGLVSCLCFELPTASGPKSARVYCGYWPGPTRVMLPSRQDDGNIRAPARACIVSVDVSIAVHGGVRWRQLWL